MSIARVAPRAAAVIGTSIGGVQVVAAALEDGVPVDGHLDVEVAGGPGAVADLALTGELDAGAGVDARRAP